MRALGRGTTSPPVARQRSGNSRLNSTQRPPICNQPGLLPWLLSGLGLRTWLVAAGVSLWLCACGPFGGSPGPSLSVPAGTARYLALGDSYTICTGSSSEARRWPDLVARRSEAAAGRPVRVTNLGVNGFTTSDLISVELPHLLDARWDYVSILIGVNDFFQGYDEAHYRVGLVRIYDAVAALHLPAGHVLAVSIPDYSSTPVGASSGRPAAIVEGLRRFNAGARGMAQQRGFTWVDIFDVSRSQIGSPGWTASDSLHPGDTQYQAWADQIWPAVAPVWGVA